MIDHKAAAITAEAFTFLTTMPEEQNLAFAHLDLRRLVKEYFDAMAIQISAIKECADRDYLRNVTTNAEIAESALRAAIGGE